MPELKLGSFTLGTGKLTTDGNPQPQDWEDMLKTLVWFARNHPWWIGDLIAMGEERFGESFYSQALEDRQAYEMICRHTSVAKAIPQENRNCNLSWTHHREVVALTPQLRTEILQYAEKKGLSSGEIRAAARRFKR